MTKTFTSILAVFVLTAFVSLTVAAQDEIKENQNAPANYDANLKSGDKAVGVMFGRLEAINIVSKSGGVYKATLDDGTDNEYLFRSNAVYPYFDLSQFGEITESRRDFIMPYLGCYAEKRGANLETLKGDGFNPPYFSDVSELKKDLENNQTKLAEIEQKLKTLAARPDTFLSYDQNPAVWFEIVSKRAEYLPCAVGERQKEDIVDSPWLKAHRDGIKKVLVSVGNWKTGSRDSLGSSSEYAFYAVSPKMRADWLKEKNALAFEGEIEKLLKPLADALAEKLPNYFPDAAKYSVRSAAEEALMKRVLPNPAQNKIFATGLAQTAWQIDKGALGIPQARYKNGLIYRRAASADHPYCYATYVNVIQNYAGGGTYAASRSEIIREELVACPASK